MTIVPQTALTSSTELLSVRLNNLTLRPLTHRILLGNAKVAGKKPRKVMMTALSLSRNFRVGK